MSDKSSKEILTQSIKPIFPERFPKGYINDVDGWGIPKKDLHCKLQDGSFRLLTLDIDFGYQCGLACPHCFRKSKLLDDAAMAPLTYEEMLQLMRQGKDLGLRSVKFLGAGEPFENKDLLRFLVALNSLEIKAAIFTKGTVLGNDELANRYFGHNGIRTAKELVKKLRELNTSILLGFNSFDTSIQEAFVGQEKARIKNYVEMRNQALLNLVESGFNEFVEGQATNLAMIIAPIKPENIDEVFEIYEWARIRNIYALSCPTTFSGLGKNELAREKADFDFENYLHDLRELYTEIYVWNIKNGLMTIEQFEEEGVSLYPGCHPCNQVAAGFYITLKGKAIRCPGRDDDQWIVFEDVRKSTLREIWNRSLNQRLASTGKFNFSCIARDGTFFERPQEFYDVIKKNVLEAIKQDA